MEPPPTVTEDTMSRINTNVPSIQAAHRLATNQFDLNLRLQRISTGLRINTGRDDPAGLIASEVLRSEIRGISQAIENSTRAVNVLSTAEGSLNEISSLLLDIRGLLNHAANDGANSPAELASDQLQIDSILESINRIANTTQFGGEKLINGNMAYTVSGVAASAIANATIFGARVPQNSSVSVLVEVTSSAQTGQVVFSGSAVTGNVTIEVAGDKGSEIFSFASGLGVANIATAINSFSELTGVSAFVSGTGANTRLLLNTKTYGSDAILSVKTIEGDFIVPAGQTSRDEGADAGVLINGQSASVHGLDAQLRANGLDVDLELTTDRGTTLGTSTFDITGGGATFQLGPEINSDAQVSIGIPSVATTNLGTATVGFLNTINGAGTNSVANKKFSTAENILLEAISQVALIRGRLGGLQRNQIETNINSQRVALENVQSAESAIRDADIALEVSALTRAQILVQSTTSVLGLANQQSQNVLSLLR